MKKVIFLTVALGLIAAPAVADDKTGRIGLGFVQSEAPIGGRYWFSEKVGVDLNFGIASEDLGDESLTHWRIMGGLPINIQNVAERVHFNFLPAVEFANFANPDPEDSDTVITIFAMLEFEVDVTPDFTLGASSGLLFEIFSPGEPPDADSFTDWGTVGFNITNFGFHYYLPN